MACKFVENHRTNLMHFKRVHLFTWGNHDLILLWSNSEKGEIILRVDVPHHSPSFHEQLVDITGVLDCAWVVKSAFDWDACLKST